MRRMIESQQGDDEFLKEYAEAVRTLAGLVVETLEENRQMLLSPYFRKLLLEQAKKVDKMHGLVSVYLCADNLGEPFKARLG